MSSLVIAEHDNHGIKPATLNTVTAALACGGEVHVLVAGKDAAAAAQAASQIAGVSKVLHADADGFAHGLAEQVAAQVLALASNYTHILFAATASGKNIAPRVAAKLGVGLAADLTGFTVEGGAVLGQHFTMNAMGNTALAELINHLLNAAHRLRQIGFEKVQNAHQDFTTCRYTRAVICAQRCQENAWARSRPASRFCCQ